MANHKQDTDNSVFFYENDYYVLSNFAAFKLIWAGRIFDTSEAAYHWEKFPEKPVVRHMIINALSAHEAFKIAGQYCEFQRPDWLQIRVEVMGGILREKVDQHEYVKRKLLATGDRALIEDSWRDPFWGWGPDRKGENMLGRLWMQIRDEIRSGAE